MVVEINEIVNELVSLLAGGLRDTLRRYKITRKKDSQLPEAGPTKSSGISGRDQRYTAGKDHWDFISSTPEIFTIESWHRIFCLALRKILCKRDSTKSSMEQ